MFLADCRKVKIGWDKCAEVVNLHILLAQGANTWPPANYLRLAGTFLQFLDINNGRQPAIYGWRPLLWVSLRLNTLSLRVLGVPAGP